ncbi:MAG TPA: tetratricopeptide repeat protein [Melioribacteraceae bacterium]|nr:tetratricopeptide repeat protein [Melioribacteraceae bacterium]
MSIDKDVKYNKNALSTKKLSSIKIFYFVLFLLVIGLFILISSGIFDTPKIADNINLNDKTKNSGNPHATADMSTLSKIKDLEEQLKNNPNNFEIMLQLGHLLNDNRFFNKAIEYYTLYLKSNPKSADVWIDMGVCYFNLNDFDNAIINMEKGLEIDPNHQIACLNLGIVNFSAGNKEKADYYWKKAINLNPNNEVGNKAKQLLNSK